MTNVPATQEELPIKSKRIHNAGRGLWMDWMAQGTRITGNLCYDNTTDDPFVEVNHGPFLVDNNLFLSGINLRDWSQGGAYAHNLLAGKIDVQHLMPETGASLTRLVTGEIEAASRTLQCPQCGGQVNSQVSSGLFNCAYCGYSADLRTDRNNPQPAQAAWNRCWIIGCRLSAGTVGPLPGST